MAVLRGKGRGIELDFSERPFDEALNELEERLAANPGFYSGSAATAVFGDRLPDADQIANLRAALAVFGVGLEALSGPSEIEPLAHEGELIFQPRETVAQPDALARRRANRVKPPAAALSDAARSLAADFAGARADLAARRSSGLPIRQFTPRVSPRASSGGAPVVAAAPAQPATEYHLGTVRGGQTLHQVGNLVVVGDVNPGAELVASGDILVFGALRGVAHAGAQGDAQARVYALRLEPTQLRIATLIAADDRRHSDQEPVVAEVAQVRDGRIAVVPYDRISEPSEEKQR
ncbi:MAG: hypothetical protein JO135_07240 [Candidatus Eremiobacteraeota bacterium]|nr:hypothetical protein [Candidatus Eremiobacteraeota bacterium]